MKKYFFALLAIWLLSACAPQKMYYWGDYNKAVYDHEKKQTESSKKVLLKTFEEIISKSKRKGTRKQVPPGIYADYGFHLLQDGQIEKGMRMLEKEKELYPESEQMVNFLMSQFK